MNDVCEHFDSSQRQLFDDVRSEVKRIIVSGYMPPVFAFIEDSEVTSEFTLAVDVSDAGTEPGCRDIVRLGSFWLVPEILERLKATYNAFYCQNISQLLHALHEFNTDIPGLEL